MLRRCGIGLSLDGDFHVRPWFKAYFLALVIRQGIVNSYFSIQMIPAFDGYAVPSRARFNLIHQGPHFVTTL